MSSTFIWNKITGHNEAVIFVLITLQTGLLGLCGHFGEKQHSSEPTHLWFFEPIHNLEKWHEVLKGDRFPNSLFVFNSKINRSHDFLLIKIFRHAYLESFAAKPCRDTHLLIVGDRSPGSISLHSQRVNCEWKL